MAKFVLTIESDDPLEIASFLSPSPKAATPATSASPVMASSAPVTTTTSTETVEPEAKKRGRLAKTAEPVAEPAPSASEASPAIAGTVEPAGEVTVAEVTALIHRVVKEKSAKAAIDALTKEVGVPAPAAMNPDQLAKAKGVLEGLLG